ncbi:patatin-like phospholipase family protein [Planosporangium mesophilum]|uniref:Patatin n=1 Tax=Planosporangium mesophilum TaxID=689768 RepID=A0A8J3TBA8_9ACTN|nr:patatin-like phospholipase family protein [Planosporangium mesophilum]NJC83506.1 patatin-like phospholipase family protein [Planosporangium mesophilum]GII22017.1 patatin [Planosporangium mesophilum]
MSSALVLGGGGITGIAWEVGVLQGLRRGGVDLTTADLVVGTSAGSIVGTMVASGVDLDAAVKIQREEQEQKSSRIDIKFAMRAFAILRDPSLDPLEARARVGALALSVDLGDPDRQVKWFAARMPQQEWPERRLVITGVDAETGEFVTWDRDSGAPLVRAVAASCAVPCVFPPVEINGRRYIDGGVRSGTNADLAAGCDKIVVIAPMADSPIGAPLTELDALRETAKVVVVKPDAGALRAIGPNVLDASRRVAALEAGLAQGAALAREGAVQLS